MTDERRSDEAGDVSDDDTASLPAVALEADPSTPKRQRGSLISLIALVAALAAFACSGVLLWQYRQFYVSLADADNEAQAGLERVRAAARVAEQTTAELAGTVDGNALELVGVSDRLDALPGQFAELQRRVDAIQGGSFDARNQWLEAEAEYYLSVANSELQLGSRWDNALTALRLADDRLRETGNPGLAPVRAQIADDILAIESVRLVDIAGLAHSLSRLSVRTTELPLRSQPSSGSADAADPESEEPGLGRLWASMRNAFTSIVRVERRDEPLVAALNADEVRLIRRQLSVELQTARLALVSGEAEVFAASLEHAESLLREEFDPASPDVEGGLRLIESLAQLNVAPDPPDISRSLYALRANGAP